MLFRGAFQWRSADMATASRMKPGAGGGPIQNAKAQPQQKQTYGKGKGATKTPAKKPGMTGDSPKARKALSAKKK